MERENVCAGRRKKRKGRCISYGNGNIGNTGNGGNHSQWFPDKKICVFRTGYGGKEAALLLSGQFFPDWHCVLGFWKRCRNNSGIAHDRVQYLSWKKKIQAVWAVSDDTVYGHHQWLFVPVLLVPPYFFALSEQETAVYRFILYGLLTVLFFWFYVKGKNWRSWFHENMQRRSLRKSEKYLLWVIGILLMFFSNTDSVAMQIVAGSSNAWAADNIHNQEIVSYIGVSSISAFVMTVTIIMLIMQGNKRSFYHEKVSRMQSGMITFMAEVVENRDDNTGGHIRRTAAYVECIAKELKRQGVYSNILTDRYLSDMVVAAPLHDIGKIHIPDAVLNKPGKLTEEEFEVMKTHTTAGEELLTHAKAELGESEYLNTAVEMAAYHTSGGMAKDILMASAGKKYRSAQGLWRWRMYLTHWLPSDVIKAPCRLKKRMRSSGRNPARTLILLWWKHFLL